MRKRMDTSPDIGQSCWPIRFFIHKTHSGELAMLKLICLTLLISLSLSAQADTTITYQGQLQHNGQPYSGTPGMAFRLFDHQSDGNQVGDTNFFTAVTIQDGLFQVELDFGDSVFDGSGRWLEIEVAGNNLKPRQHISASPVAFHALSIPDAEKIWKKADDDTIYFDGKVGINTDSPDYSLQVSGRMTTGNPENQVSGSRSFVSGGGHDYSTRNIAGGFDSFIGGGARNETTSQLNFIGGGSSNYIDAGQRNFIAGGTENTITGSDNFVGGGRDNTIMGVNGFVAGGNHNEVEGSNSFAAGVRAHALHDRALVWSDGSGGIDAPFTSEAANEFAALASGGVRFVSGVNEVGEPESGVRLSPGGNSWETISDRRAKTAIEPADPAEVLTRVTELRISEYSYRSQDSSIRHMGPMAQDFHPLFGLGEDELRVSAMNLAGISLAAIQGLYAKLETERAENADLRKQLTEHEARLAELEQETKGNTKLEKRLVALEALLLKGRQDAEAK